MAVFIYNEFQEIQAGSSAVLNDSIPCNKGYIVHRNGSGIVTLKGLVNNPCAKFARYTIHYECNIAVPATGTAGEIQVAVALGGEVIPTSISAATPTAVNAYFHASGTVVVDIPAGCCYTIAIENASVSADPATTPDPALLMRNLHVDVERIA